MHTGTPSLCKPHHIQQIIAAIGQSATLVDNIEITMEANPTSTEMDKMNQFKQAGINRLSVGIQVHHKRLFRFVLFYHC